MRGAPQEIEWQLDATDLEGVARWLRDTALSHSLTVTPAGEALMRDRYIDTADRRAWRAGYTMRLRETADDAEATLKGMASSREGIRRRTEWNERLLQASCEALLAAPGAVGRRARALAGRQPLVVLFAIKTFRRRFRLEDCDGRYVGEVALDETSVLADVAAESGVEDIRRVEVEAVDEAAAATLAPLVEEMRLACELGDSQRSKFEAGARAAGLERPSVAVLPPLSNADRRRIGIGALARRVIDEQRAAVLAHEPGTRLGDDPEALHDMRVATRRLRSALRLFRAWLPPEAPPLREQLRWLAGALGEVRDLDVQIERIEAFAEAEPDLEPLAALLRIRRDGARERMLAALDDPRYEALLGALEYLAASATEGDAPALTEAPALLARQWRRFNRLARQLDADSPDKDYHATRVVGKRLRYAVEFVAPLYGKRAGRMRAATTGVQDRLGAHQDAAVAIEQLRALAGDAGGQLPAATLFAMGALAERYAAGMAAEREAFPEVYRRVRLRWRALERRAARGKKRARR